jgi:hypothetical protein
MVHAVADLQVTPKPGFIFRNSDTITYRVVKEIPASVPHADRLPSVGGTFEFWPWGETIGKLCSGLTFEAPQLKALEAKKVIERVTTQKVVAKHAAVAA